MAELHFEYFVNIILFLQQSGSLLTFIYRCIYLQTKIFIKRSMNMKSNKESFSMLMALLIGDCIKREIRKPEADIDLDLLLMCDKLLEVLYPSEPLTEEEVSKRVRVIKERTDQEQ